MSIQPKPGWTYTVERTTLPEPVKGESGEHHRGGVEDHLVRR